jgi:predicted site-specific integrase-resolvase
MEPNNHRYLSGKSCKEILQVSDNTLRRWSNEGKIKYIRNSERGKRFYDISSLINEQKIINQATLLSNNIKSLTKNNSDVDLKKQYNMNDLHAYHNIIMTPIELIKGSKDDSSINYAYDKNEILNIKKQQILDNNIICYCKVQKKMQKKELEKQINKLQRLYIGADIITSIAINDTNLEKNGIMSLLNKIKENKLKKLIINKSDYITDALIANITDICKIFEIEVISI